MSSDRVDPSAGDRLTGLPGRAALQVRLAEACDAARAGGRPLSVLALDLDHFGRVNDQHLLPGGDRILAEVARRVAAAARPGDWVARDGGDQFAVVLAGAGPAEASRKAERIRLAVAAGPIRVRLADGPVAVPVTVSVGVATLGPGDAAAWDLFRRAREAVHRAKDAGRNRVEPPAPGGQ